MIKKGVQQLVGAGQSVVLSLTYLQKARFFDYNLFVCSSRRIKRYEVIEEQDSNRDLRTGIQQST
jgi:hypothetical protein